MGDFSPFLMEEIPMSNVKYTPEFKKFHKILCERFGYVHDEKFWWKEQTSLIEFIAAKIPSVHMVNIQKENTVLTAIPNNSFHEVGMPIRIEEITSIGWLHNHDGSICLTICLRLQNQPIFVTISKNEFDSVGGKSGINENKQLAINFYKKYGAGRPG